ncbi:D-glycero-beta-D-manno-heptose 1-phosphate adenylyltransferase [Streptomyces sp. DT2A-34]|uniref:D-glycero-beta-D-manno-heptose 1-phosphate adenylyltransferase n=1 Tax=Streptomyces sp. DT2A-34 TaxID=3051182 RepID=UPI00265B989D|nr:D-glycero-beta-D-manno-heptose 1-phosphate adenylyltransferase [Streptomyces sp. DT2A-34]MDO0910999.1 D-glycero-beta-D-manno-heptose 1-phosphate adenylyltransferase [Streptomyces sp. DT2A-34]
MSGPAPLLVVGDALLDHDLSGRAERLAPDAPVPVVSGARRTTRPGGAALAACLAAADGRPVTLVTALGDDPASASLRRLLAGRVDLVPLPLTGTLSSKTRVLAGGRSLLRLDDGDGRARRATDEACRAIAAADAVLVADYGRGTADVLRDALADAVRRVPVVWDPHPRGQQPLPDVRLVTPSATEARGFAGALGTEEPADGGSLHTAARDAGALVRAWRAAAVAVTLGGSGALLSHGETPLLVPSPVSADGDACGAGDRFAATAAGLLADGELTETAVRGAVHAATRYVAEGGVGSLVMSVRDSADATDATDAAEAAYVGDAAAHATTPQGPPATPEHTSTDDALRTAARVRAAGGTVVAAGGCFDLLHAGHVALLQAARRTGDCLVVCVNSDTSVRRRKGDGRPLVPLADRIRVLRALECVDAVAVFDEDTPERLLGELRPHIWAKGGDYARVELPEAELVASWGGQVVLLPYLDGRSTTGLAERAALAPRAVAASTGAPDGRR